MGGGNYTLDAPPNSFIDVRNFSTVEALTKYLKYLIDNPVSFFVNRAVICYMTKKITQAKEKLQNFNWHYSEPFVFVV